MARLEMDKTTWDSLQLAVVCLALGVAGCGDVDAAGGLSIDKLSAFSVSDDGCTVTETVVPSLEFDAGYGALSGSDYLLGVWVSNSLKSNEAAGTSVGRTNTNRIQVERFVLSIPDRDQWGFLPAEIDVPNPVVLDSEARAGQFARLIPAAVAKTMVEHPSSPVLDEGSTATLRVELRAEGRLLDGDAVESNTLAFTLTIGNQAFGGGCGIGQKAVGCSIAQRDGYDCEEESGQ